MPKHVFKKLSRELKIFVNTVIVTKLWQCYIYILNSLKKTTSLLTTLVIFNFEITTNKGPFIFYEVGGAGGIWGGVTEKKTALKGEPSKKNKGKRGGHVKYFSNALRWDMFYYS